MLGKTILLLDLEVIYSITLKTKTHELHALHIKGEMLVKLWQF